MKKNIGKNEYDVNKAIACIFRERYGWDAIAEKTRQIVGHTGQKPDVIVKAHGMAVIIETEYPPNQGLDEDVDRRLDKVLVKHGKPSAVIGVILPERLIMFEDDKLINEIQKGIDFKYYMKYTDGVAERFPEKGVLAGGLVDLAAVVSLTAVPWDKIKKSVDIVYEEIARISKLIEDADEVVKKKIARRIGQKKSEQTWNMAGLMIINAGIFYEELSAVLEKITPFTDLSDVGIPTKNDVLKAWIKVLDIDYIPIFEEAAHILKSLPDKIATSVLDIMGATVSKISALGVTKSGDVYGAIYQNMLDDRKRIAAYYTRPEAAALLTNIILPSSTNDIWSHKEKITGLRIADFACGTGMLLTHAYYHIKHNANKNMIGLHKDMIENCFHGYDIFPIATHLTISNLAALASDVKFADSNVITMKIGPKKRIVDGVGYDLGSLDLLSKSSKFTTVGTGLGGSRKRKLRKVVMKDASCDYVIMNPPYTRMTNHTSQHSDSHPAFAVFDIKPEDQKNMAVLLKKMYSKTGASGNAGFGSYFTVLGNKKLKPGGKIGLILPGTVPTGSSWKSIRKMLDESYTDITVITTEHGNFSFGTSIREIILIAEKKPENVVIKKESRIKLVRLNEVPESRLLAVEIGKVIRHTPAKKLENDFGSTMLKLGTKIVGSIVNCPSDGNGGWSLNSSKEASLASFAHNLIDNKIENIPTIGIQKPSNLIDDEVGIGIIGKVHRDIADNNDPNEDDPRAPFMLDEYYDKCKYPTLWKNDHKTQRCFILEPTHSLEIKPNANPLKIHDRWNSATHVFINNNSAYNSQRLIASYTTNINLGGRAWVNVSMKKNYEKPFVVWCNSIFGILLYWFVSGSQQPGRGIMGVQAFRTFPVLNFGKLNKTQLDDFTKLFDEVSECELKSLNKAGEDLVRKKMDSEIMRILGVDIELNDIYKSIKIEPQFGYKRESETRNRKIKNDKPKDKVGSRYKIHKTYDGRTKDGRRQLKIR